MRSATAADKQSIAANPKARLDNGRMPLSRYTLRQLEAFAAVADAHSFAGAGERLGLTAQAVSQLVAEFEATLGFRLFDRTTRRVALSSAGRDLRASIESVLRHVQAAEKAADDVRQRAAGVVRVGAPMVLAAVALPAAIQEYQQQRPNVAVRIRDLAVDRLVDAVAAADVDLAVGPDRVVDGTVAREALFESPWVLWCAPRHPLAAQRSVRWAELRDVALVAAGRDHERSVAQMRLSAPEGARIVPLDVVDNISTALGIAAQGLAATLAPAYIAVLARAAGLEMRRVVEPESVRSVCLYRSLVRSMSPAAQGFAEHLAAWLRRWGESAGRG